MPISTVTTLVPVVTTFNEYASRMESDPTYFTRDYLMSRCRDTIDSNLRYYYRFRSNRLERNSEQASILDRIHLVASFGVMIRSYIRDNDVNRMYDLVNSLQFRFVRDGMRTDWANLIEDKFGNDAKCCEDCNHIAHEDDGSWCYDGDYWVCDGCRDNNYRWSENRCTYITEGDYYEEEEEEEEEVDVTKDLSDVKIANSDDEAEADVTEDAKEEPKVATTAAARGRKGAAAKK